MSEWWTEPYKGGPMVAVEGFPRPLYPPDASAHGKTPSVDGPDCDAYKRVVSRAGRWPSQPFDDSYSNGFAHGTSGNVAETGVAGVQRQQHIMTADGSKATFNSLRSIRVPLGLPNAGEMAMDAQAVALINKAWRKFGGHEPAPADSGTVRMAALKRARGQLGVKESPPASNRQKYGEWYKMNGVPWCAIFVTWSYELGATDVRKEAPSFVRGTRYSYCPYVVADARAGKYGLRTTDDPIPGDLVVYDWEGPGGGGVYDHIGIFENWITGAATFEAIEGNTSLSNNSNGGEVMRRTRNASQQGTVFVRVAEPREWGDAPCKRQRSVGDRKCVDRLPCASLGTQAQPRRVRGADRRTQGGSGDA
jgi:hypothetical protein